MRYQMYQIIGDQISPDLARTAPVDKPLLNFAVNVYPEGPPKPLVQALAQTLEHIGPYPDTTCHDARQALATSHETQADQILLGNGAVEIFLGLGAGLCQPG